ncbi:MAG: helix-turn-helix transcriptional regulator [Bacteroidota bacterium]
MSIGIKKAFGQVTRRLRKALKMSQRELARKSEIHVNTIQLVELGLVEIKLTTLFFIAKGLGVPLDEFMRAFINHYYSK